jgi:hypothetical protein
MPQVPGRAVLTVGAGKQLHSPFPAAPHGFLGRSPGGKPAVSGESGFV